LDDTVPNVVADNLTTPTPTLMPTSNVFAMTKTLWNDIEFFADVVPSDQVKKCFINPS
jgi:hypothetical protein